MPTFNISGDPYGLSGNALNGKIVFEGDSHTARLNYGATKWSDQVTALGKYLATQNVYNFAQGGAHATSLPEQYYAEVGGLKLIQGEKGYLFVWAGTNDLLFSHYSASMLYKSLKKEWNKAAADGFDVVAFTVMPIKNLHPSRELVRKELNALIRNNKNAYDILIDPNEILTKNTSDFKSDGIHLSGSGNAKLAEAVLSKLTPLGWGPTSGPSDQQKAEFAGNDVIAGSGQDDWIFSGTGQDLMLGGGGNDRYFVDNASDKVMEAKGSGFDQIFTTVSYQLTSFSHIEFLGTVNRISTAAIKLTGNQYNNLIQGTNGANKIDGGPGADKMWGYSGRDVYVVDNPRDQVFEDKDGGVDRVITKVSFSLPLNSYVEEIQPLSYTGLGNLNITGSKSDNRIYGTISNNTLYGEAGNDVIQGGAGKDIISGDKGLDTLFGGPGADVFLFRVLDTSRDIIMDFSDTDRLAFSREIYKTIGPKGNLNPNAFHQGAYAHDLDDRIIFDPSSRILSYDRDGSGSAAVAIQIALIRSGLPDWDSIIIV